MKKILFVKTLLMVVIILVACTSLIGIDNELVGRWYTDGSIDEVVIMNAILEFNSDGTGELSVYAEALVTHLHRGDFDWEFEWSAEDGNITLEIINEDILGSRERLWSYSIDNDILVVYDLALGNDRDVFERID